MASGEVPEIISPFVQQTGALLVFIVLDIALGVACASLNGISMQYYRYKMNMADNINHTLYFSLSVFGVVISYGALLHCFILIFTICYTESVLSFIVPIAFIIVLVSTYVSTMINICLSVIRTIHITSPLKPVSKQAAVTAIGVYGLAWLAVACIDVYYWSTDQEIQEGEEYYYTFINMSGDLGVIRLFHRHGLLAKFATNIHIYPFLIYGIPCVIPSFICLLCAMVQIGSLWARRRALREENNHSRNATHQKITVTILLLTAVFFVTNTLSFTYCIAMVIQQWNGYQYFLGAYIVSSMVPLLNALLNPIILITRGKKLRRYFKQFLKRGPATRQSLVMMASLDNMNNAPRSMLRENTVEQMVY